MPTKPPGTPDLDLTDPNTAGTINGGVFMTGALQPAGTGNFNSFVQIQNNGFEQGYNTDASAQYNEKSSHNHNHSVLLADVPIVFGDGSGGTVDGLAYREFLLDLNEPNGTRYISLDALQIWQEEAGNLTNFTPGAGFAGTHTNYLAYDLDAGGDKWIALDASMAHGSGESDYRILIPDSFFINDAAHRYVTLYSAFGAQSGWESGGGFEEWGLHGASGGAASAIAVSKTATVDGGTADEAGEVISYSINVANVGNQSLTGLTVTDPSVTDLAPVMIGLFNAGDTNLNGVFNAGETWQYSASYTVTQFDIDQLGTTGEGAIVNTVTADTAQTNPVSATASVTVVRNADMEVIKSADVSSVDAAGDVINYTVTVENTGNASLTGVVVNDPLFTVITPVYGDPVLSEDPLRIPIMDGDYNAGDTNQNGVEDPGETFQYDGILGDDNGNGIEDPGEEFQFANAGDTNQNGVEDGGETFQYYNAGDTDHDGEEDPGETFQFVVNSEVPGVDSDDDGFNDGDVNEDGVLNIGETWTFAVSYTVTQDDIDNGGVFDPGLSLDNTATATTHQTIEDASTSVDIDQNPSILVTKDATVGDGTVDEVGDTISYTIGVTNNGNMTLTDLEVDDPDPGVENLAAVISSGFNVGDADMDGKLDIGETWQYTASHTVTQSDLDAGGSIVNTASATTAQSATDSDDASVTVVQNPSLSLDKSGTWEDGPEADGFADAGEEVHYTFAVTNNGNVSLDNVAISDALFGSPLTTPASGDTTNVGVLDVGETWIFNADYTITAADVTAGNVHNVATATADGPQDQPASDVDMHDVTLPQEPTAHMTMVKSSFFVDSNEDGVADTGDGTSGDLIQYFFNLANDGGVALTSVELHDSFLDVSTLDPESGDDNNNNVLDVGETWNYAMNYFIQESDIEDGAINIHNEAHATALDPLLQVVMSNIASVDTVFPIV